MLSKTRTTVIALVAAFSFAGASLVPPAAQANTKAKSGSVDLVMFGGTTSNGGGIIRSQMK